MAWTVALPLASTFGSSASAWPAPTSPARRGSSESASTTMRTSGRTGRSARTTRAPCGPPAPASSSTAAGRSRSTATSRSPREPVTAGTVKPPAVRSRAWRPSATRRCSLKTTTPVRPARAIGACCAMGVLMTPARTASRAPGPRPDPARRRGPRGRARRRGPARRSRVMPAAAHVGSLTRTSPGAAWAESRDARFTARPNQSPSCPTAGPAWMPTRARSAGAACAMAMPRRTPSAGTAVRQQDAVAHRLHELSAVLAGQAPGGVPQRDRDLGREFVAPPCGEGGVAGQVSEDERAGVLVRGVGHRPPWA